MSDDEKDQAQQDQTASTEGEGSQVESGEPGDIGDAQLPDDLQPTEDNPLARHPEQTGEDDDVIGADREEGPETAPLREEDADYGSGGSSSGSSGGDGPDDGRVEAEEDDGSDTLENGGGGAG